MFFARNSQFALIKGSVNDNRSHRHYAIQLTIRLDEAFEIDKQVIKDMYHILPVMQEHRLTAQSDVVILLINPASSFAQWLRCRTDESSLEACCIAIASLFSPRNEMSRSLLTSIEKIIEHYCDSCSVVTMEPRIEQAMRLLEEKSLQVTSANEIAEQVGLSPSRFLHLFKAQMAISYRRYQLWLKLMASIDELLLSNSITEVAHDFGFADSAHYSRTFKECFGFTPKAFKLMQKQAHK